MGRTEPSLHPRFKLCNEPRVHAGINVHRLNQNSIKIPITPLRFQKSETLSHPFPSPASIIVASRIRFASRFCGKSINWIRYARAPRNVPSRFLFLAGLLRVGLSAARYIAPFRLNEGLSSVCFHSETNELFIRECLTSFVDIVFARTKYSLVFILS